MPKAMSPARADHRVARYFGLSPRGICRRMTPLRNAHGVAPYSTALTIASTTFFASPKTIIVLSM